MFEPKGGRMPIPSEQEGNPMRKKLFAGIAIALGLAALLCLAGCSATSGTRTFNYCTVTWIDNTATFKMDEKNDQDYLWHAQSSDPCLVLTDDESARSKEGKTTSGLSNTHTFEFQGQEPGGTAAIHMERTIDSDPSDVVALDFTVEVDEHGNVSSVDRA